MCGMTGCAAPVDAETPLELCTTHLLVAHDWVSRDSGVTDALPSPCLACGSRVGIRYPSAWLCAVCEWRVGDVPDAGLGPPRVDVVYYLRFRSQIKIGTTANPRSRFAALPHDEVLAFELGDRLVERRRHEQFAEHRIPGTEWFHAHAALAEHIAVLSEGVADPWSLHSRWVARQLAARD